MQNPLPKQNPHLKLSGLIDRSPEALKPWPKNPRRHSDKQIFKLKASIVQFGFTAPVLVDEAGVILSGHGRVEAAKALGLASVPTRMISGWTMAQKRAYVLTDNKLALLSSWDDVLLKEELEILIDQDFAVELTGFTSAEIDIIMDSDAPASALDPAELLAEDMATEVVSHLGDLWVLGHHRLLCGDALLAENYQTVMQSDLAQMVITDAPYNVPIAGHVCGNGKVQHKEFAMASGEMSSPEFTAFLAKAFTQTHAYSQDGAIHFYFMDWRHMQEVQAAAQPIFGHLKQLCVWVKDNAGMGTFYRSQHELVFVFKKGTAPHINNFELGQHGRYRTNVWSYPGVNTFTSKGFEQLAWHPTVKPVGLIADAIRDCSRHNDVVLDPFAGSGTILIAAERTGRQARAIELDPQYVDVGIHRWERVTGKQAVLAATGQTWEQVRAERLQSAANGSQP